MQTDITNMSQIGEPIKRHEVIPLENEPVVMPEEPKAPVKEPAKEDA